MRYTMLTIVITISFVILIFIIDNILTAESKKFEKIILSNPEIKGISGCTITYCGDIAGVDCHSEVDGPFFYVNKYSGEIIGYCGGYCMGGPRGKYCTNCPPKEWNCSS